jgi:Protein of unknown function (DUF1232)
LARAEARWSGAAGALIAGLWVLSPIDLIPEFLPVIGPLHDVVVVALAFRYAARRVPREVLLDAWPGIPRILERLLGVAPPACPGSPADTVKGFLVSIGPGPDVALFQDVNGFRPRHALVACGRARLRGYGLAVFAVLLLAAW